MGQFAVIGLGRFGSSVARCLSQMGHEVLGIDQDEDKIQEMANILTHAVQADATDEATLKSLGIRNFDCVIVSIGQDIQASILVTLLVKELGVKYVVAKALNDLHGKVLSRIGADRVVYPERDMGVRVAQNLVAANVLDYIELAPHVTICELVAPERLVGKTLRQLNLRSRYGVNIMAIKRDDKVNITPLADDTVRAGDILVLLGDTSNLQRLQES